MAAAIKTLNAKIRSNPVTDFLLDPLLGSRIQLWHSSCRRHGHAERCRHHLRPNDARLSIPQLLAHGWPGKDSRREGEGRSVAGWWCVGQECGQGPGCIEGGRADGRGRGVEAGWSSEGQGGAGNQIRGQKMRGEGRRKRGKLHVRLYDCVPVQRLYTLGSS